MALSAAGGCWHGVLVLPCTRPRFASGTPWTLAAGSIVLMHSAIIAFTVDFAPVTGRRDRHGLVTRQEISARICPIQTARIKTLATDSGLVLYVPADGDQIWDAPWPPTLFCGVSWDCGAMVT